MLAEPFPSPPLSRTVRPIHGPPARRCPVVLRFRILDIEHEMTQFAFYYVGIAAAVFLLGYFQVGFPQDARSTPHPAPRVQQQMYFGSVLPTRFH